MFDYSILHWTTFFAATFALTVAPGPDIAFILGQSVSRGRRAGFCAMLGIWAGASVHVVMAAIGLSAVLVASATAFAAVKWLGAAYLVWLGIGMLRHAGGALVGAPSASDRTHARIFRQGIVVAALNPKVAVFFLAFLPQFVVPGAGPVWAQLALHGLLVIAVSALVEPPLVLAADRLARAVRHRPAIGAWIDRVLGGLLIGLGVKLATTRATGG